MRYGRTPISATVILCFLFPSSSTADETATNPAPSPIAVISSEALEGTWTDSPDMPMFRTTWHFDGEIVTHRRHTGRVSENRYTLLPDRIVVHHEKSLMNDGAWDEELELVSFEDSILIWVGVTRMKVHKLK